MQRFHNILYFADGAVQRCPAFERAVALARANHARLTLFDVLDAPPGEARLSQELGLDLARLRRERREEELEALAAPLREEDSLYYVQVVQGIGFVEVIRAVLRNQYDLVIKPAHPPQGISARLFGSSDLHLLRKCPCPVWIDRPGANPYRHILATVDPLAEVQCDPLVLALATTLAERESARLTVLHAWELEGESVLRGSRSPLPQMEVDRLEEQERRRHETALEQLLAGQAGARPQVELRKGAAAPVIRERAQALQADLIVMGTLGRSGIPGFFIGNTAEEVLQSTECSVLAVKPAGFVSPVTL